MKTQIFPFRSSALNKQSVVESAPVVYPFRDKAPALAVVTSHVNVSKPRLIEDKEDAKEFTLCVVLLGAIIVGFILAVELMYPGWSLGFKEVFHD